MTSLFCDLAGFTSQSEETDPEDLDRMLDAYFSLARRAIERHGGVVEKFIGDAVVGVFGAAVAHEDDPARAVRAGLEICSGGASLADARGEPLRLRVGINTGEAFVRLDVRPDSGEHILVGDAVNTAARIQTAAPLQGVAVGSRTWEATRLAFDYEELPAAHLKGKAEAVRIFHALAARQTPGVDPGRAHVGPYVGRRDELARLLGAYEAARTVRQPRLVVISGEPGIGKSRLLAELGSAIRSIDPAVTWRQGRCLPYGDGTGFWSLGEIVKTHAGILEGDNADVVLAKLATSTEGLPDAEWLRDRLLPLVGLPGATVSSREEQFAAWAAYLRSMAGTGPAAIAFEDVHWADPALLELISDLAASADAPLLLVLTTRPETRDGAPLAVGRPTATLRIDLRPLDDADTRALIVGLLGDVVPEALAAPILQRSEGNPLYAEEFVRLLGDRDLLERRDGAYRLRSGTVIPVPESIHGLLASRLDTLREPERLVISRAAIVGAVFWPGAVAALGVGGEEDVSATLATLADRELVRPLERSSMAGEAEFAFWHALARDVAYESQPRGQRLDGHLAAAAWVRARGGREDDVAGIVAHHLVTAFELAVASGDARAATLQPEARDALARAAAASFAIDADAAASLYLRAVRLTPPDDPSRAPLLLATGVAAERAARNAEAIAALEEALALYEAAGQPEAAARVMLAMQQPLQSIMDGRREGLVARALEILERAGPTPDLVRALTARSWLALMAYPPVDAIAYADRAIDLAATLGLPIPTKALAVRGQARVVFGDDDGLVDFGRAFDEAIAAREWLDAVDVAGNYAAYVTFHHGVRRGDEITQRALAICDRYGLRSFGQFHRLSHAGNLAMLGELDRADAILAPMTDTVAESGDRWRIQEVLALRADIALARGDAAILRSVVPGLMQEADREGSEDPALASIYASAALQALGRPGEALRYLRQALAGDRIASTYWWYLPTTTRVALALGEIELAADVVTGVRSRSLVQRLGIRTNAALVAEARGDASSALGDFIAVAPAWGGFGAALEEGAARLGAARCHAAIGAADAARAELDAARAVFVSMGARPWLEAVDELRREIDGRPPVASNDASGDRGAEGGVEIRPQVLDALDAHGQAAQGGPDG